MAVPCRNLFIPFVTSGDLSSSDLFIGRKSADETCRQIAHFARTLRNDFYCNCPLCDDERDNNLDCDVCLCPTTCSSGIYCDGSLGLWGYFAFDVSDLNPELFPFPENEQTCKVVSCFKSLTLVLVFVPWACGPVESKFLER